MTRPAAILLFFVSFLAVDSPTIFALHHQRLRPKTEEGLTSGTRPARLSRSQELARGAFQGEARAP